MPYYPPVSASGAPIDATYITQIANGTLTAEQNLAALATGLLKNTTTTGVLSIAADGTDYFSPPFLDTNTLIKGSADPTKLLRWEVDGFTAGATRVMTPPDQDILLAGQNFANVFTAAQTIQVATASILPLTLKSTDDSATNPYLTLLDSSNNSLARFKTETGIGMYLYLGGNVAGQFNPAITMDSLDVSNSSGPAMNWYRGGVFQWQYGVDSSNPGGANGFWWYNVPNGFYAFTLSEFGNMIVQSREAGDTTVSDGLVLDHNIASGTPAAGFGTGLRFRGQSSTTNNRQMARLAALWDDSTDASRSAALLALISNDAGEVEAAKFDDDATGGNTRLLLYDVDNGQLERVSVGTADSGGSGFKLLRIVN